MDEHLRLFRSWSMLNKHRHLVDSHSRWVGENVLRLEDTFLWQNVIHGAAHDAENELIFVDDSISTLRYVESTQTWRMEDDGNLVAEFIADGESHALQIARAILKAYDEWFGGGGE